MRSVPRILVSTVIGGLVFWLPDVTVQANWSAELLHWPLLSALVLPILICGAYLVLEKYDHQASAPSIAAFMLLGVWLFGPLAMSIAASYHGGGFNEPGSWVLVVAATFFPVYTFMMATYHGTLLALLFTTVLMAFLHLRFERHHWILPPGISSRLQKYLA